MPLSRCFNAWSRTVAGPAATEPSTAGVTGAGPSTAGSSGAASAIGALAGTLLAGSALVVGNMGTRVLRDSGRLGTGVNGMALAVTCHLPLCPPVPLPRSTRMPMSLTISALPASNVPASPPIPEAVPADPAVEGPAPATPKRTGPSQMSAKTRKRSRTVVHECGVCLSSSRSVCLSSSRCFKYIGNPNGRIRSVLNNGAQSCNLAVGDNR